MSMIGICRFPPTLSPLTPSSMASTSHPPSSTWWRKTTVTEENRTTSTSGERVAYSLGQGETRQAEFGASANLLDHKNIGSSLQNEVGVQSSNIPTSSSRKRPNDWDQDLDAPASSTTDEPGVKRRVTMSSIREHENLSPENRIEELSDDAGSVDERDFSPRFGHSKTISDPSSEKKKTKRFRLTHNQTRFLMSEFTRQAHPDAAHRERLSREIPGLSPRQVQVWFQNRRAKLKRLTSQDRERMLKSRALPEDFDIGHVLNQPYSSRPSDHSPLPAPHGHGSTLPGVSITKPLLLNATTRPNGDEYSMAPSSAPSIYGNYGSTPASLNAHETSPLTRSDRSFNTASRLRERAGSQTDIGSLTRTQGFSSTYARSWLPVQRLQLQQTDTKSRENPVASPLRTSISYSEGTVRHENTGGTLPGGSLGNGRSNAAPTPNLNEDSAPHTAPLLSGLPFQNEQTPSTQSQPYTNQTQDDWRVNFNVGSSYRAMPALSSAPLSISPDYQYPSFNSSFGFDSFYPYNQHNSSAMNMPAPNIRPEVDYESQPSYNFNADDELNKPTGLPHGRH